jgi:translation elongation factor EF-Ts
VLVGSYIHSGNKIATLVAFLLLKVLKRLEIAMQAAAMSPIALTKKVLMLQLSKRN